VTRLRGATHLAAIALLAIASCSGTGTNAETDLMSAFPGLTFDRPLWIGHAGDGSDRLFVVEQAGLIRVFENDPSVESMTTFLDLHTKVRTSHTEEGMLALAFHPKYADNGLFFVYYSASDPRRGVLSRFRVSTDDHNHADPTSETVMLEIEQPYGNHNGSTLVFGPDDFLYMSLGDGGSAGDPHGHGQNLGTLLGSILRIDVDQGGKGLAYAIPSDNPFVDSVGARGEIWAYGLRNVWRMSFDSMSGELWAADVGQNLWEEIDLIVKGGNYGWNIREGAHPYKPAETTAPLIDPIYEYDHSQGASITGGYVYRGSRLKDLYGAYIYADFVTGTIWALRYEVGEIVENKTLLLQPKNISSFGIDAHNELYLCAFDGKIYRIDSE